jgi:adenosylmethionine-8-amino-7-oxononanoate aminotransferase
MQDHEHFPLIPIDFAEGIWLHSGQKRYLDAISSWWTNLWGHRHPLLMEALVRQSQRLDHVIFAGFTHQPAEQLAEILLGWTGFDKVFYTDNGSSAVEAALKMAFQFYQNQGLIKKTRFICLENSYHGETLGALAVGGTGLYRDGYQPLLMQPIHVPAPDLYQQQDGQSPESLMQQQFAAMQAALDQHAHETCAVIVEPLVQCAGGMRMYHPHYLRLLHAACQQAGVLLIFDEIAVGFGRTGSRFAFEQAGVKPDLLCLSKGITGGTLPLAAVLTTNTLYEAFYDDYATYKAFLHSHSYTGNPLACAVAVASAGLLDDAALAHNQFTAQKLAQAAENLKNHPEVADVRQTGLILAIELTPNGQKTSHFRPEQRRGLRAYRAALQAETGVLLRPLGSVLYWMPPYVIQPDEIDLLAQATAVALEA